MSDQTSDKCPLCLSNMDLTDKQLKPCKCGYEICLWCWHRIIDESGGRCPGCRSVYNKDEILARNQILKELPADKSNYQKDQTKSHKQTSSKVQLGQSETKDPNSIRVIQRKLVYIVGMPTEFASEKLLRQKSFLGQYGKIENIIIDNIGANQQIPDSGRVYVTFAKEEEAVRCIQAVDGYTLDGRPLKATFGVTRYCHIWLSNRVCYKPNCSYVHYKASAEDICTKDDVSVVCARLQHLMGMSTKCLQHRSGRTFPPPGCCSSKNITCNGISKDLCINNDRLLPNGANKNTSLLPATTPWDSSLSSGSPPSMTNMVLHQRNDHESIHNNQQSLSDVKSQKYIPPGGRNPSVNHIMQHSCRPTEGTSPKSSSNTSLVSLGPKGHLYEHSGSKNDESQASSQLRNDSSNSKQMNLAENGISDTLQQKTQYADVVSQGQVPSVRRFTVLGRPTMTSKATEPTKLTLIENEHGSCIANPVSHPVSQSPEQPAHLLASASVKSHAGVQKKDECTDIREKLVLGDDKQLPKTALSQRSTVAESMSSRTLPSNLSASNSKIQGSAGPHNLSDLNIKLAAQNQLPLVINQQSAPVSNAGIARASSCFSTPNRQASLTDGRRQNPTQGVNERLHNREIIRSGNVVSSRCSDSTMMSRPVGAVSSAPDRKERRQAYPPGFEKPQHSSDSTTFSACSGLYSASDSLVQGSCGATDQQGFTSWATDCQRDDGDVTQNLSVGISLPLSSTNTNQSRRQFPGTIFGWSNHPHFSFYPSALRHAHHKPEYRDGTTGYAVLPQGITSGMRGGMASTLLQQSIMSTGANGNADSGTNCPQVDISYPMYTLF